MTDAVADGTTPAQQLSPEELQKRMAISQRLSMAFGQIVNVLMRSPTHKHLSLADLEWAAAPAIVTGQFALAEAQSKANGMVAPVAAIMWAFVSDEVDARISASPEAPVRLTIPEWRSGQHLWVMEAVGDPRVVGSMIDRLLRNEWTGRSAKTRTRTPEGKPVIALLQAKPPEAPAA
jgi:hemolysin-activating ACP:hemolysin acyltransferase